MRTYEQDYAGWAEDTASAIEAGKFDEIDLLALADEVRDLGKSERYRLESALRVLLLHLLKTKYQPEKATPTWQASINIQRRRVAKYLRESPSLRPCLPALLAEAYGDARIEAGGETDLDIRTFPEVCEWTLHEVLGDY